MPTPTKWRLKKAAIWPCTPTISPRSKPGGSLSMSPASPDKVDGQAASGSARFGIFGTTALAFFLAEMGDKTQIATVALAARYESLAAVVAGTTLGMMLANAPAVFLGDRLARKVPMTLVHGVAALIFAVLGVLTLLNVGGLF